MGAPFQGYADDAALVYAVYHYPTGSFGTVYNGLVVQQYAHMGDTAILLIKKSEVAALRMLQKINQFAHLGLLTGIAR